jgi:hypothetical protein
MFRKNEKKTFQVSQMWKVRGPHSPKSWKIKGQKIVMALENFDVSMQRWLKISSNT